MSRIFALSWMSISLIVFLAALHRTDALKVTCRRCVGSYFARNWKHFIFAGAMPLERDNCDDHLDTIPDDQQCQSEVCLDVFVKNLMANPGDKETYSHVRGCAEDLLGKPIPMPASEFVTTYCDFDVTPWCKASFDDTNSPFNVVCGDTNETYASLCTTKGGSEPPCNNQLDPACIRDFKTNPCVVCDPSANHTECENERTAIGKWCTTTTIRRGTDVISVERGATPANPYAHEGNLTRTIGDLTYTIDYCKTPNCNGVYPWTGTSTTTAAPTSTGSTVASTAAPSTTTPSTTAPSTASPSTTVPSTTTPSTTAPSTASPSTEATSVKTEVPITKLSSSIVASALAVGFCAMLSALFGR